MNISPFLTHLWELSHLIETSALIGTANKLTGLNLMGPLTLNSKQIFTKDFAMDTQATLNVHKTFTWRRGRHTKFFCMFSLGCVTTGFTKHLSQLAFTCSKSAVEIPETMCETCLKSTIRQ